VAHTVYLLDSNVFITAARNYYAFDVVPSFWENLARLVKDERIQSIDRVRDELLRGNDSLADWINKTIPEAFKSTRDDAVAAKYKDIIAWAQGRPQYKQAAKNQFAGVADGWLIAYALTYSMTVVTNEAPDPNNKRKVLIPIICDEFSVPYVDTFKMLREIGVKI
jgi:predicted nucleic acid-binding protein